MTLSTWQALGLAQLVILLLVAVAVLGWTLWRRPRTAAAIQQATPQAPPPTDDPDTLAVVSRFLEGELARTRAQQEANDRNLPEHVLSARARYLQAELDALAYTDTPDPFWAHLCECIDGWNVPQARALDDDDESLAATHSRLQRLLGEMEREPPSQVVVRQLAVIERRLAAIQRQTGTGEEDNTGLAAAGDAGQAEGSEQLR
ncbi:hypothetical protein HC341_03685 [Aquisalimonas sp. 2447]|uniref:hypothetical protein n=1 Tax=Aquisalimonas sp. 2447 TaxID=2740807 RepID=UPI001432668D|nr:hypothetical protein [Aquisalimonas sp. 2447]QIT54398.1 hypothetical protein HC341_03685 [Aquisalimonas sp. 2447]